MQGSSAYKALSDRVEAQTFASSSPLLVLNTLYLLNFGGVLLPLPSLIEVFMLTAVLNMLNARLHPSCGLAAHILLSFDPLLSTLKASVDQHLHPFIPSAGSIWNNLSAALLLPKT